MDIILATFIRPVFVTRAWHSGVLNCHNNNDNNNNNNNNNNNDDDDDDDDDTNNTTNNNWTIGVSTA